MTRMIMRILATSGVSGLFAAAPFAQVGSIKYGPTALGATSVPTIGGLGLLLLAVLMAVVALRLLKERKGEGSAWLIAATLASAFAAGGSGIKLVSDAQAVSCCSASVDSGGTVSLPFKGNWDVTNYSTVKQYILKMEAEPGCYFASSSGNGGQGICKDDPSTALEVDQYCSVTVCCEEVNGGNGGNGGGCEI